jgi:anti-sigma B factor antagonist
MRHFVAKTATDPERAIVMLAGECDLSVREDLTTLLLDAVNTAAVVAVDLAAVTFMDSSGLHALMTAHQTAQRTGRRLYVIGAAGAVASLLRLTGLHAVLSPPAADPPADPPAGRPLGSA